MQFILYQQHAHLESLRYTRNITGLQWPTIPFDVISSLFLCLSSQDMTLYLWSLYRSFVQTSLPAGMDLQCLGHTGQWVEHQWCFT